MHNEKPNIGIITFPTGDSGNVPLSNLIDILSNLSNNLYLITGNKGYSLFKSDKRVHVHGVTHETSSHALLRVFRYARLQVEYSFILIDLLKRIDVLIFFIGGQDLILPLVTAKLFNKTTLLVFAGSSMQTLIASKDKFYLVSSLFSEISCILNNRIILYSENLIGFYGLEKWKYKITICHRHFIDSKFKSLVHYDQRANQVAYIGRMSLEKGVLNFVNAIPFLVEKYPDLRFVIIGDGILRDEIMTCLDGFGLLNIVEIIKWVPHKEMPNYLNKLRLVVLPSYTEGLPNILLESMACGTPVLATPVGGIPNLIIDSKNGFLMENNTPKCIAENVIRILEYRGLDDVILNAQHLIEQDHTYKKVEARWENLINSLVW